MDGKTVYVDIAKAKRAGARLVSTEEIVRAIDQYAATVPSAKRRWAQHIKQKVLSIDREILVQPRPMVPADGIFSERGLAVSLGIVKYARVVQVVGLAFTAYDVGVATGESMRLKSIRPVEKEAVRQASGWAGAVAGARVGAAAGAMVGIELGPGTIITGAIGGLLLGAVGYFGGSYLAGQIPDH